MRLSSWLPPRHPIVERTGEEVPGDADQAVSPQKHADSPQADANYLYLVRQNGVEGLVACQGKGYRRAEGQE